MNAKPRLCLTVGITGHRAHKLAPERADALGLEVQQTLAQLGSSLQAVAAAHGHVFASDAPQLRLVTALADGSDTLVAQAALAAGWRVDACLPFARDEYATDFAAGPHRDDYFDLLARSTACFELPGKREQAQAAYEAVGRLVLEQCDVLLALWDGDPNRGRGGTSRVVADAVARHIAVLHLHTHEDLPTQLLWTGLSDAEIEQPSVEIVPRAAASDMLPQVIAALTIPPEHAVDQRMLQRFYKERAAKNTPALPYPALLAFTGVRPLSRRDFKPMQAEASAQELAAQLAITGQPAAFSAGLVQRFGLADTAGAYFAQIFRSGFVANFAVAAVAVVLALSGLLLPAFKLPIICLELLCVMLILLNTHAGKHYGWHERWMDNRHLAEQLRALAFTSTLGDLSLRSHLAQAGHDAAAVPGWVSWLSRATARETGLPNVHADAAHLARVRDAALKLITDQMAYQHSNAGRMHKLEHRLHRAGEWLFGGTIVACVGWIVAKLSGMPMGVVGTVGVTEIVTFVTAVLPSMGAAIYGIRMQGDFAGVAFRAHMTATRLERLQRAMQTDPLDYLRLDARLRNLADIMLTDVSSWRTTYQARPLALPG